MNFNFVNDDELCVYIAAVFPSIVRPAIASTLCIFRHHHHWAEQHENPFY